MILLINADKVYLTWPRQELWVEKVRAKMAMRRIRMKMLILFEG